MSAQDDGEQNIGDDIPSDAAKPGFPEGISADTRLESVEEEEKADDAMQQSKVPQTLKETWSEHLARHDPKMDSKTCSRCAYHVKLKAAQKQCVWEHPSTKEQRTWLMEHLFAPQSASA